MIYDIMAGGGTYAGNDKENGSEHLDELLAFKVLQWSFSQMLIR